MGDDPGLLEVVGHHAGAGTRTRSTSKLTPLIYIPHLTFFFFHLPPSPLNYFSSLSNFSLHFFSFPLNLFFFSLSPSFFILNFLPSPLALYHFSLYFPHSSRPNILPSPLLHYPIFLLFQPFPSPVNYYLF